MSIIKPHHQRLLLQLAKRSIQYGLLEHCPLRPDLAEFPLSMARASAVFVTLTLQGKLRGCIGNLEAEHPLPQAVANSAYDAAYKDPRFPPLNAEEVHAINIEISVLSAPESMIFDSEAEAVIQLRPNIDGLIFAAGKKRATFLPAVWRQLPDAREFLSQLKRKAGFAADYWDDEVELSRYTCQTISPAIVNEASSDH